MNDNVLIRIMNINKSFPGVAALKNISVEIKKATVHALVGENGAGKSTLMKILSGAIQPDSGVIFINNKPFTAKNEKESIQGGISMVYQELNYIPQMTVEENLFLGREPKTKWGTIDRKLRHQQAKQILQNLNLNLDTNSLMCNLSVANIQMIEIAKALSKNVQIIIFDEPTSSLSDKETQVLFDLIRQVKEKGITILYISHRFEELDQIADYITVIRDGEVICTERKNDISREKMIHLMVGRPLSVFYPKQEVAQGEIVLKVSHLTQKGVFEDISFDVRAGEILGFSGLVGAGRSEVMQALFGLASYDKGEIQIDNKPVTIKSPWIAQKEGIVFVPEDRKRLGLVLCRSIAENITLPHLKRYRAYNLKKHTEKNDVSRLMTLFNVKAKSQTTVANALSGGNQQKVVLCKWLLTRPKILILDEPTRGIDVGAKQEIYAYMTDLAKEGYAIIMVSSELPEILGMSDRVVVMCEGKITAVIPRNEMTSEIIMKHSIEVV